MTPPICSLRWKPESGQPLRNFNGVQNGKVCKNHNNLKFSQYFTHLWKVCLWGMDPMQWYALSPILIKFQLQSLMSCQFQIEKACLNLEHQYKLKQKLSQYKYNSNEHGFHRLEKYGMWTHMNQLFPIIPGCILSIVGCWVWSIIDWWTSLLLAFLVLLVVTYFHWLWLKLLLQKHRTHCRENILPPDLFICLLRNHFDLSGFYVVCAAVVFLFFFKSRCLHFVLTANPVLR